MRKYLFILFTVLSFLSHSQDNKPKPAHIGGETIPIVGSNSNDIMIFLILSDNYATQLGMMLSRAHKYNDIIRMQGKKYYLGKKVFLTPEEIAELDTDEEDSNYKYIFRLTSTKGSEGFAWAYNFGTVDIKTGMIYYKNNIYQNNQKKEAKRQIKFLEECRIINGGK
tara:strand:+ start:13909 stop:14409 length:501 start_codon:yes stop_codon:yes gene_type:complete